jgi:hypothetical protein
MQNPIIPPEASPQPLHGFRNQEENRKIGRKTTNNLEEVINIGRKPAATKHCQIKNLQARATTTV